MQRTQRRIKLGKGCQGTCVKDPGTKPKGGRIEGGRWGAGESGGRKMETTVFEQQFKKVFKRCEQTFFKGNI